MFEGFLHKLVDWGNATIHCALRLEMRGVFFAPSNSHHVRAQASGKIASRKIVC
jgi:hypothetical protein